MNRPRTIQQKIKDRLQQVRRRLAPINWKYPPSVPEKLLASRNTVSRKHEYIYFRIPKAANSTIVRSLAAAETGEIADDWTAIGELKNNQPSLCSFGWSELNQVLKYYKFAFVREPWRRLVSAYLDKIHNQPESNWANNVRKQLKIAQAAEISLSQFIDYLEDGGLKENAHWSRQTDLIQLPVEELDFVGKIENIEDDFRSVSESIFGHPTPLVNWAPHSTSRKALPEIDAKSFDRALKLYQADYETFDYPMTRPE